MATVCFEVYGRVQGVGFRYFAQRQANTLGLGGWVRNREDGSVEIMACGDADALDEMEGRLRKGPSGAAVRRLIRGAAEEAAAWKDFRILE
ncbi:MAG: acylphosphatase [Terriglobales bacterium]